MIAGPMSTAARPVEPAIITIPASDAAFREHVQNVGPMASPRPDGSVPTIAITTTRDRLNGVVRVTVSDNGPGVSPADRDKLFMPYYSTKGRGSGLGLAIVRRIVVEHGGAIEVGVASPSGTVFTIELPDGQTS